MHAWHRLRTPSESWTRCHAAQYRATVRARCSISFGPAWDFWRLDYATGGTCPSKAKITGKTVVITGANAGIGKETAWELARRGGHIIMGCRDMEKCEAAAKEIRRDTLNHNVFARHLDLASMKSITNFAKKINEGHFLLTNLLLDKMKSSAPSRIINVSSLVHLAGQIDLEDLNWERKKYDTKAAYCQSKLANVMFTKELARRLQGKNQLSAAASRVAVWPMCLDAILIPYHLRRHFPYRFISQVFNLPQE
ncbi:RDH13 dehydrogenase, partial [Polypterus senegalus]